MRDITPYDHIVWVQPHGGRDQPILNDPYYIGDQDVRLQMFPNSML